MTTRSALFSSARLALAHLPRRVLERGQLVHAVVDDRARVQLAEQRQRHRRVEPDQVVVDQLVGEVAADHRLQRRELVVVEAAGLDRRVRAQHLDALARRRALEIGRAAGVHRLLDEDDVVVAGEPRQQVLRTLEDELPAQVREDDEVWHGSLRNGEVRKALLGAPEAPCVAGVELALQVGGIARVDGHVPQAAVVPVARVVPVGTIDRPDRGRRRAPPRRPSARARARS